MTSSVITVTSQRGIPSSTVRQVRGRWALTACGEDLEGSENRAMLFAQIWHFVRGKRRQPTSALMLRRAQRLRDEGRYRRAAGLVDEAVLHDPRNVVGHLLAASLH